MKSLIQSKNRSQKKSLALLCLAATLYAAPTIAEEKESVSVGAGQAKLGGLFQAWALNDTSSTAANFNYRLRRAEIKLSGSVTESTRWFAMIDAAKTLRPGAISSTNDNKILQDLGIAFSPVKQLELIVGQFKTPATAEGLDSSAELLFPERSYVARAYGDRREPGMMLTWKESFLKASAMVSNGQGTNVDDTNNSKDLTLRLDATPVTWLTLGAFTTGGDFSYKDKARWGANARLNLDQLLLRFEGVRARELNVSSNAWTADAGYTFADTVQPIARYERFDNGTLTGSASSLGLNYFLLKHNSKIQASYGILNDMAGNSGSYTPSRGVNGTLLTVSFQAAI